MPARDDETTAQHDSGARPEDTDAADYTVTPYAVEGEIDYDDLVERFGADPLTDDQIARLPDHPAVRRGVFYAGRDVDRYAAAAAAGRRHSIVTGVGPSGPLHVGHLLPLRLAKRFQDATGAHVTIPLSDDEKFLAKDLGLDEIGAATRDNLRDILAMGFDPERTTVVVDTLDADVLYPLAVRLAAGLTQSTVEAVYGRPDNAGLSFYPAMQAVHLLLPQFVHGPHPTLVPVAVDQDPHVRVCRDLAAKERFDVTKPGALLGRFLPDLTGPGKMSSSDADATIRLTDDRERIRAVVREHAFTGGRATVADHRERGGDPTVDVPFQYLRYLFEPEDRELARIERAYRSGELLSGELKALAAERIADDLAVHRERRDAVGDLDAALAPYRLSEAVRERLSPTL